MNQVQKKLKIIFVHHNFPGQFKFLAPKLVELGHEVFAMPIGEAAEFVWEGVKVTPYRINRGTTKGVHPWVSDFETKTIRGDFAYNFGKKLRASGLYPDVIIAHPGWGESLFLKQVWPDAKLGIYCEFFYQTIGADVGFDPEFPAAVDSENRIKLKNLNNLLHMEIADLGISPTEWQRSTYPEPFKSKIITVHDGIDTDQVKPDKLASITLSSGKILSFEDEVITFVNRNLEPYRGYHTFMRSLPRILKDRPEANVLIIGEGGVSYGSKPNPDVYGDLNWKTIFINEVKNKISLEDWDRVHFVGKVPYNIFLNVMQISSVHIYLTYPFVLSWSLLEAMSAGCAIVASDTNPLHEAITHDQTGLLVDFFNQDKLASVVNNLLDNESLRTRLGACARQFAIKNYDLKTRCLPAQLKWVDKLLVSSTL